MTTPDIAQRGLYLLGCGKMGSAMLSGWLEGGLPASAVWVTDPFPSPWLEELSQAQGLHLNAGTPPSPAVALLAVKPQMMDDALPALASLGGGDTLMLSVAAGTPLGRFEQVFGAATPIVRAMPNTPAAIGKGITAIIGNGAAGEPHLALAQSLLSAIGEVIRLEREEQMDAVTAVSGSGPAYVFHMVEAMAAAGETQGLSPALAMQLARATVSGAGALVEQSEESVSQLRINVTSPAGTTEAGLKVLMDEVRGLPPLLRATVEAAAERSRELGR
ncbi:MAG: pyrroline-5-carboxylate reductase [Pseudomonadota bacterium]